MQSLVGLTNIFFDIFKASAGLSIRRLLPLPASDWRDFSQDWFCGCCDNHKLAGLNFTEISRAAFMY